MQQLCYLWSNNLFGCLLKILPTYSKMSVKLLLFVNFGKVFEPIALGLLQNFT